MESSSSLETVNQLRNVIQERDETVKILETSYQTARLKADKLNKALSDSRSKFEREKAALMKEQKADVKVWKKDLGVAISNQIKLEKSYHVKVFKIEMFRENSSFSST